MRELKKALRKELINRRKAMDLSEKALADADIFEQLKPLVNKARAVFTYASTEIEVDTRRLIDYCLAKKIPVALPVSGDEELLFFYINRIFFQQFFQHCNQYVFRFSSILIFSQPDNNAYDLIQIV